MGFCTQLRAQFEPDLNNPPVPLTAYFTIYEKSAKGSLVGVFDTEWNDPNGDDIAAIDQLWPQATDPSHAPYDLAGGGSPFSLDWATVPDGVFKSSETGSWDFRIFNTQGNIFHYNVVRSMTSIIQIKDANGAVSTGIYHVNLLPITGTFNIAANTDPVLQSYTGIIDGTKAVTKQGVGTLTLTGANTYTGTTTISEGTLKLGVFAAVPEHGVIGSVGSIANTPSINVATGAVFDVSAVPGGFTLGTGQTLGGTGNMAGMLTVGSGAIVAPGNSPGTITFLSGLALDDGSILDFQIGTISDMIAVTGGILTGPGVNGGVTLNLSDSGGFGAGTYTLFDFTGATLGDISTDTFALGSAIPGYDYSLNLNGSTLELNATVSSIPEPSTFTLLLGVAAVAGLRWRRAA